MADKTNTHCHASDTVAQQPTTAADHSRSWIGLLGTATAALGWGLFLGLWFFQQTVEVTSAKTKPAHAAQVPRRAPEADDQQRRDVDPRQRIQRADFLLQYGSVQEAYEIFEEELPRFEPPQRGWLTYRLAIACELSGDTKQALHWYERLHTEHSDIRTRFAAETGRARVLLRQGKFRASQRLLCRLAADPQLSRVPDEDRQDLPHLLAQAFAAQVLDAASTAVFVATPHYQIDVESLLNGFSTDEAPIGPAKLPDEHFHVVMQMGSHVEQTFVSCYLPAVRLDDLLARLAAAAGQPLRVSDRAQHRLKSRLPGVFFDNISVAAALDRTLDALDLRWQIVDNTLDVHVTDESSDEENTAWHLGLARRMITRALIQSPDSPLAADNQFLQANLEYSTGEFETARSLYEASLAQLPEASKLDVLWFNYAAVLRKLNEPRQAIDAYFHVVDRTDQQHWKSTAYLQIGRLHLEDGRYEDALRPLIRAISLATDEQIHSTAAVTLASAYLLIGNVHAGHTALVEARPSITTGPWRHYGGLLEALCRFRTAHNSSEAARVQRQLFESTLRAQDQPLPVMVGWLLITDAMQALGLESESARLLERASGSELTPHVRDVIEQRLVDHYLQRGKWDQARRRLEAQLESDNPRQANQAAIHWCRLMLRHDELAACLDMCRRVLDRDPTDAEKVSALEMMGQAYQSQRKFEQAALCFAGLLPAD